MKQFYLWLRCRWYKPNGGKHWQYTEAGGPDFKSAFSCGRCKHKRRRNRYMVGLQEGNRNQVLCIYHYVLQVPGEAERLMLKLVRPLSIGVLALILVVLGLTYIAFSHKKVLFRSVVTPQQIENVVDEIAARKPNVCREILTQEVEAVADASPDLAFFALTCGIIDVETGGTWDPGTRSKVKNRADKWVPGTALGLGGVLKSHLEELKRAGIVPKDADESILFHPVYGARACVYYVNQYVMEKAKGNTKWGLKLYLQGEGDKYAQVEWNMRLEDYFTRAINAMGRFMLVLDTHADAGSPLSKKTEGGRQGAPKEGQKADKPAAPPSKKMGEQR
jgi:hypothetical protein